MGDSQLVGVCVRKKEREREREKSGSNNEWGKKLARISPGKCVSMCTVQYAGRPGTFPECPASSRLRTACM